MALQYLVTGANGHLGSAILRELDARGAAVRALVLPGETFAARVDAIDQPTDGFATRRYLRFAVQNPDDWARVKERLDPHAPERTHPIAENDPVLRLGTSAPVHGAGGSHWRDNIEACNSSDLPVRLTITGLYWGIRDFVGMLELSMMFYDQPALVHEMFEYWTRRIVGVLFIGIGVYLIAAMLLR